MIPGIDPRTKEKLNENSIEMMLDLAAAAAEFAEDLELHQDIGSVLGTPVTSFLPHSPSIDPGPRPSESSVLLRSVENDMNSHSPVSSSVVLSRRS